MYRLFARVPDGLKPVADAFRAHVEGEGGALVRAADEAAASRRERVGVDKAAAADKAGGVDKGADKKDKDAAAGGGAGAGAAAEQQFVRDVVALHDKVGG